MERKHTGKIVCLLVLMYASLFGNCIDELLNRGVDYDTASIQALLLSLISFCLSWLIMSIVPFIARMIEGQKLSCKKGKRLCLWNSIVMFIISCVLTVLYAISFVGGIGAILFYFINKWLFVSEFEQLDQHSITTYSVQNHPDEEPISIMTGCLSDENEVSSAYDNHDIPIFDTQLEQDTKLQEAPLEQQTPQDKQTRYSTAGPAIRYCSRCGQIIDPVTKKCRGCAKQYFRGIPWKVVLTVAFLIIFVASIAGNVFLYISSVGLHKETTKLKNLNNELNSNISNLKKDIANLKSEKSALQSKLNIYATEIAFYDNYIVFVADDNTNFYHNYDCVRFQECMSFWVYGFQGAESNGYTACPLCLG